MTRVHGVSAEQPVTHMSSTNSKPQPSNQFPMKKKSSPALHFFLFEMPFHSDISQ